MSSGDAKAVMEVEQTADKGAVRALKCPSCGSDMVSDSEYCPRCGRKATLETPKEDRPPRNIRKSLLYLGRDVGLAVLIVVIILGVIYAYTRVWPPMVVIESESMQHGNDATYIGVIDTGDLVLVQAAPQRSDVTTWVQGMATGYMTYGNYGDVIIFKTSSQSTPIIHRPMFYMEWNAATGKFDIPDLDGLPRGLWRATYFNGTVVVTPRGMDGTLRLYQSGWDWNLTTVFDIHAFLGKARSGYVTMGDNNAYRGLTPPSEGNNYDRQYFPRQEDIVGKARGELPWFGLIKLVLYPGETGCCKGWGDSYVPKNSWDSLVLALVMIIATPIVIDISSSLLRKDDQTEGKEKTGEDGSQEAEEPNSIEVKNEDERALKGEQKVDKPPGGSD